MTKIHKFNEFKESYTNKFNFILGKKYQYEELPDQVKLDIDVQFENAEIGESEYDYYWEFKLMKPDDIVDYLQSNFGEYLDEAIEHEDMQKLIKDIQERGIDYPSVGVEGNHRALACWYLEIPLPYLDPVYKY